MISYTDIFRMTPILCSCRDCIQGNFQKCENHNPIFVQQFTNLDEMMPPMTAKETEKQVDDNADVVIEPEFEEMANDPDLKNEENNFNYHIAGEDNDFEFEENTFSDIDEIPKLEITLSEPAETIKSKSLPSNHDEFFGPCTDYSDETLTLLFKLLGRSIQTSHDIFPVHFDLYRTFISRFYTGSL